MSEREQQRLAALRELNLLDSPPSESFDRITRMASQLFNLPMAAVSLTDMDRQWFKSRVGLDHCEIPREKAPCAQCSGTGDVLVLPDLLSDENYRDSGLAASGIRFYAGAPLVTRDGFGLGAMCVVGTEPREVSQREIDGLKDLAAMVMAQIELQHAFGRVDPLSGLPNRNQFAEDLEDLARDYPGEQRIAVLVDLVGVTQLTDALRVMGPSYIDDIVRSSTSTLRGAVPPGTKLYQIGTTHFAYLIPGGEPAAVAEAAEETRKKLESVIQSNGVPVTLNAAVGIVPFGLGEMAPRDVLRTAHSAAQDARDAEAGVGIYSADRDNAHLRRFMLLAGLRAALISGDQLSLAYQPRIDVRSGSCVGAEALLRWRHPVLGDIPPGEFIPLVEQTALVKDVTEWVIGAAIHQVADWRARNIHLTVSVNVSAANLEEDGFATGLIERLNANSVPANALEIELTESAIIRNGQRALQVLAELQAAGLPIAIDDFGTGYSSLSYLQKIPASTLKIDRSFISTLLTDRRAATLVGTMISMAHDLQYRVVAEGVETAEARDRLAAQSCDEMQGYFFARPLPVAAFEEWLRTYQPRSFQTEPARRRA